MFNPDGRGCAPSVATIAATAAAGVVAMVAAVALSTGPAGAAPAEEPRLAQVCTYQASAGVCVPGVGSSMRTWIPPAAPRG